MDWTIENLNRLIAFVLFVAFVIQPLCSLGDSISRQPEHSLQHGFHGGQ